MVINEFVKRWDATGRAYCEEIFSKHHPYDYIDVVTAVIKAIEVSEYDDFSPDPGRIHSIDWGDYQGTLFFIIGEKGYQPSQGYYCLVDYGSCSGCDTLESIRDYNSTDKPSTIETADYVTLCLHVLQSLKVME